jgi:hypothetical protein
LLIDTLGNLCEIARRLLVGREERDFVHAVA